MRCVVVRTSFLLLAALCIQDTTAYTSADCDYFKVNLDNKGWHSVAGSTKKLKIVTTLQNHEEARKDCQDMMGDLASIGQEQTHKDAMCWLQRNYKNMQVWLGGIREDDALIWLEDGDLITDNWRKGQPDFSGGKEYCVAMNWGGMGLFNDDRCQFKKPFICEYNLV